jgi:hypothetical protein
MTRRYRKLRSFDRKKKITEINGVMGKNDGKERGRIKDKKKNGNKTRASGGKRRKRETRQEITQDRKS